MNIRWSSRHDAAIMMPPRRIMKTDAVNGEVLVDHGERLEKGDSSESQRVFKE